MRVLVCGDRNWADMALIRRHMETLLRGLEDGDLLTVIEGGARGADSIAGEIARSWIGTHPVIHERYPADWSIGLAAGPIRNRRMLKEGQPDLVLAFHDNLAHSKGTADMVKIAKAAGIPVEVISHAPVQP